MCASERTGESAGRRVTFKWVIKSNTTESVSAHECLCLPVMKSRLPSADVTTCSAVKLKPGSTGAAVDDFHHL